MSLCVAEVVEVVPEQGGVRVRFKDLVHSGFGSYDFVRVLQTRMSEKNGACLWLPEVGEFGVVGCLEGGYYIWLGSLPYLNKNQVDPADGIYYMRHQSGIVVQIRKSGDFEVSHPSGFRITVSKEAGALPELEATSDTECLGDTGPPVLEINHPSGAIVSLDADGNGEFKGFKTVTFQEGDKRFAMEGLFDYVKETLVAWATDHTHTSVSPGSPTSAPIETLDDPVLDDTCSPDTFLGPQGGEE